MMQAKGKDIAVRLVFAASSKELETSINDKLSMELVSKTILDIKFTQFKEGYTALIIYEDI